VPWKGDDVVAIHHSDIVTMIDTTANSFANLITKFNTNQLSMK